MSQIQMMRVTHADGQCHTCDRVTYVMRHVAHIPMSSVTLTNQPRQHIWTDKLQFRSSMIVYICMHVDGGNTNE